MLWDIKQIKQTDNKSAQGFGLALILFVSEHTEWDARYPFALIYVNKVAKRKLF